MFSIIIPTYNRYAPTLIRLLDSIKNQKFTDYEIILADQSDIFFNREINKTICKNYNVDYLDLSKLELSLTKSRNAAVNFALHNIILFLDDDVELIGENYLEEIKKVFDEHPDCVGVSGFDKAIMGSRFMELRKRLIHFVFTFSFENTQVVTNYFYNIGFYKKPETLTEVDWLFGFNMAYRTSLFKEIQFDEKLKRYAHREDADFSYRAKQYGKLIVTPTALVWHHEETSGRINLSKRADMELSYWAYLYWKNIQNPNIIVEYSVSFTVFLRYLKKAFPFHMHEICGVYWNFLDKRELP